MYSLGYLGGGGGGGGRGALQVDVLTLILKLAWNVLSVVDNLRASEN